ncbi:hypothetical protein [Burkholderia thailandensis]|uniref:hypothetical protein n=1 Tax=Burkholderia thailandensis TaxID=57975 RepID=UPI0003EC9A40|nr:hypothetical protein [Burkholderia thailandensis]AHI63156.1 hypothetical protein BTL_1314 [Burkholderia thailandensis H0587]AOJ50285.1 hypothetical protein AQ475_05140 [Burkholderia thailandensis]AVR25695.1 hypothetical protein A8H32_11725 [Burkholderia thailandensis]
MDVEQQSAPVEKTPEERTAAFYSNTKFPGAAETPRAPVDQPKAWNAAENLRLNDEQSTQQQAADPDALALVRNDPARKFYGDEGTHGVLYDELTGSGQWGKEAVVSIDDGLGGTIDRKEFAAIVADHGGNQADVREFIDDARLFAQAWPTLSEADKQAHLADAVQGMKETFGSDWEQAWDAANALAKRDPRMAKVLVETGLGADRKTVIRFAQEALRQRVAGRLK